MEIDLRLTTLIGVLLIILGALFVLAPIITRYITIDDIPSWLLFVYKRGSFYFVTSPILILIFVVLFIWRILNSL